MQVHWWNRNMHDPIPPMRLQALTFDPCSWQMWMKQTRTDGSTVCLILTLCRSRA